MGEKLRLLEMCSRLWRAEALVGQTLGGNGRPQAPDERGLALGLE